MLKPRLAAVIDLPSPATLDVTVSTRDAPVGLPVRRRVRSMSGSLELDDGETLAMTPALLTRGSEEALRILTAAVIVLAVALVLLRT